MNLPQWTNLKYHHVYNAIASPEIMRKTDEILLLETFISLAQSLNLQKSSGQLMVAKSTLSRRIDQLEQRLGVALFERRSQGFSLTEDGKEFLNKSKTFLSSYQQIAVPWWQQTKARHYIHLSCPYSLGTTLLIPWISAYRHMHPNVFFDLELTLGHVQRLSSFCDLRFSHGKIPSERVYIEKLGGMPRVMLASPEYLKCFGTPQSPEELENHSLLGSQDLISNFSFFIKRIGDRERLKIPFHPSIRLRDHTGAKKAAIAGAGIAVHALKHDTVVEIENGSLVKVLPDWEPEPCPISLQIPMSKPMTESTKQFRDFIFTQWNEHPILLKANEMELLNAEE